MIFISILFTWLLLSSTIKGDQSYIIVHPTRQVATLGSTITLQCRVKVMEKIDVFWVKDGFGLGNTKADIRQYGRPVNNTFRYDLPYNTKEGEYDLRITDLELSDEGLFYCQFAADGKGESSQKALVQVLVASDNPILIQKNNQGGGPIKKSPTNPIIVYDGEDLIVDCIAENGRPGAKLYWFVNDIHIDKDNRGGINGTFSGQISVSTRTSKSHPKLYNAISTLRLKINSLRHGNLLKCVAQNSGYELGKLRPVIAPIEVHTVPIVKIEAYPKREGHEYVENDVIEFSCSATGRPSTFTWRWYLDGKQVINIIVNKYTIRITRSMHRKKLKCYAMSKREGSATVTINVKYGPKFLTENTLMYAASVGESVEMSCPTDSNPQSSITWQRESSKEIIVRGIKLRRDNIQEEDFGVYRCTATVMGFSPIFKNSYLAMKKAPFIPQPSVSYGREGQSARLACSIESVPLPKDSEIKWMFNQKAISNSERHKRYQEPFHGGVIAVLQILALDSSDFGEYNCSVKTSLGSASGSVRLLNKGETPVLMIVGASIIFLFILLVTTVVLCICKKKRFKSDYEKGNPSSPEIPESHNAKTTLIDSDCHCNPNLYSWIPQTLDLKENRGLLHKVQNQEDGLWSKVNEMDSSYTNSLPRRYHNNDKIPLNKQEILRPNPLLLNLQNQTLDSATQYPSSYPYATLAISRNPNLNLYDQSPYPHYLYQEFCPNIGAPIPSNFPNKEIPSPVYLLKNNLNQKPRQFPSDYYAEAQPIHNQPVNECMDHALVSKYASNI